MGTFSTDRPKLPSATRSKSLHGSQGSPRHVVQRTRDSLGPKNIVGQPPLLKFLHRVGVMYQALDAPTRRLSRCN